MGIEGPCVSTHQIRSIFSTTGSIGNGKRRSHRGPLMTDLIRGFALTCQLSRIYPSSLSALEFLHHSKIHSGNTGAYWYKSRRARFSDGRQCSTPRIRWTGSLAHSLVSKENRTSPHFSQAVISRRIEVAAKRFPVFLGGGIFR